MKPLRIGTRGSALALWQANHLRDELAKRAGVESELVILKTSGDKFAGNSIEQLGVVGVFTKELEEALSAGRIDLAIHSMKDVPTDFPGAYEVATVFEREDPRDALVSRDAKKLADLRDGAIIGTGSLRRASQLRAFRSDFQVIEMRGNVDTRLKKLEAGECDAVVLALAGLTRLGLAGRVAEILAPEVMLSAVGQGALGVEFLKARAGLFRFLDELLDLKTSFAVAAERAFQARMQGGCRVPLGAWARFEREELVMDACVLAVDGSQSIRRRRRIAGDVNAERAVAMGRELGQEIADAGGARLLRQARKVSVPASVAEDPPELAGKKIVITRAPEHSIELTDRLEQMGAEVVQLPMVRFVATKDASKLDASIRKIREFDWVLFTSQVAVRFYAERCRELGMEPQPQESETPPRAQVAVVGRATAKAAQAEGMRVDYIAETERGEGLASDLVASVRGKTIFLPHSNLGGEPLARALREAGAIVTSAEAYATVPPERVSPKALDEIRNGQADVILFASPSAFRNFAAQFEKAELANLSRRALFAAIGPTTRKAMDELGIDVAIEAADPSSESMAEAIAQHFRMAAPARIQ
ncbi:MAG TPA: hydroxymethylbilane synthase [Verrucomicrobiae bacterium]|nr:hydroxymethylbilane synthase [Verrucomicrobiae bacterium]